MRRKYKNPLILKVFPARIPESSSDWNDPESIGVSLVVAYYPRPYSGMKPELVCVDARNRDNLKDRIVKPDVDIIIGYGLECWDLRSLFICKNFIVDNVDMIDLAEVVKDGVRLYTSPTGSPLEETGRGRKLVDILTATLNDDYKEACDYIFLTQKWLDGYKNYVINRVSKMVRGIYRLFVFADIFGYLLVPSSVKGRVDKLVLNTERE